MKEIIEQEDGTKLEVDHDVLDDNGEPVVVEVIEKDGMVEYFVPNSVKEIKTYK
jgi:hypothetical protein